MLFRNSISFWVLLFCSAFLLLTSFLYYPKWNKPASEATISWDASGYYMYLPATFIYHDLKKVAFLPEITRRYSPDPYQNQAHLDSLSGNQVMKYPLGLAVLSLPFFGGAHVAAKVLGYPADGFSAPYQLGLQIGSQCIALLGLGLVWWVLRRRFGEKPTALTLFVLVLGSNYLDYAAIDGGMAHSWLFTLYAALLLLTSTFYARPTAGRALAIGALCGLMALTRPTDILAALLPVLWGLYPSRAIVAARLSFWRTHWLKLGLAVVAGGAVGSLQLFYWHYVTGRWLVYSYGDQGFSWLHPHLWDGIFSFRSGWLTYSPLMVMALLGLWPLRHRQPAAFWPILVYTVLFIYVTFAWDVWWYGGSLGQRAMVQSYAVLAWPMAAASSWLLARPVRSLAFAMVALIGVYYNFWMTHQAHRGTGLMAAGDMTRQYFWHVVGRNQVPIQTQWLLDNGEQVLDEADRLEVRRLWNHDFEQDAAAGCATPALRGNCSLALDQKQQFSPEYRIPIEQEQVKWVRVRARALSIGKEWDTWKMAQLIVSYQLNNEKVKSQAIRIQRVLEPGWPGDIYLDLQAPKNRPYDNVTVSFWNADGSQGVLIDDLVVEAFRK